MSMFFDSLNAFLRDRHECLEAEQYCEMNEDNEEDRVGDEGECQEETWADMGDDEDMKAYREFQRVNRLHREGLKKEGKCRKSEPTQTDVVNFNSAAFKIGTTEYFWEEKVGIDGVKDVGTDLPDEQGKRNEMISRKRALYGDKAEEIMEKETSMDVGFMKVYNTLNPPMYPCVSLTSLGLSPETIEIQDLAKRFATEKLFPTSRQQNEKGQLPLDLLKEAGELGFGGIYCSPEHGGTGLSRLDASVIFEQLSAGCSSTGAYMSIHNMCAWMIDTYGTAEQREKYVCKMAAFEWLGSYCLTEPGSGSDAAALTTSARKEGDYYVVNGSKAFISGSGVSNVYIVMMRHEGVAGPKGIFSMIVEAGTPGFELGKNESKLGWCTHPTRIINFENCKIPVSNRLGGENEGFNIAMAGINGGRINIASCSLGAAQMSMDYAVQHLKDRKQFNKRLADFQWNQFKIAEMATKLHTSRLIVRDAANHLDNNTEFKAPLCAMAKVHATDNCFEVINQALQMFGGYGVLKDYPIERYLRDSRVHQIIEGTNEIMKMIVARDILTNDTYYKC
uniref:Acyl-CoA dehydrogenase n=1 Tax=Rhabditophanes sp. KR3021 TaxID=114890 RepID=A0AC35TFL8_9BILA